MDDKEIIFLWLQGYSKQKVAELYKQRYNQHIKIIRASVRNRHAGRLISAKEALAEVEGAILREIQRRW